MKTISADTRISELIKANPLSIDAIASINPHFKKLQNPVLRKLFASRVTIREAAKIGKCDIAIFFEKLEPLGFTIDYGCKEPQPGQAMDTEAKRFDVRLDVRPDIASGKDPFNKIIKSLEALKADETLLLVNSFEPLPLIRILKDKAFKINVVTINPDEVHTYIRKHNAVQMQDYIEETGAEAFLEKQNEYRDRTRSVDVRDLPMPQPMITILKELETLSDDMALFVHHKKLPVFLLPELEERNFAMVYRQVPEGVQLIIYRNGVAA